MKCDSYHSAFVSFFPFLPDSLTSSAGPRPRPRPEAWYATDLPVAAAQAGPQHRLHVLVLRGVLRMIEALRLLILLAAAMAVVVTAGTVPTALKRRDGMTTERILRFFLELFFLNNLQHQAQTQNVQHSHATLGINSFLVIFWVL